MNQDGKPEQKPTNTPSGDASGGGKILLTLCTSPQDPSPYQHATIRFPASYQDACTAALKVFAAYIPPDVEAVSLRQMVRRGDGQAVWGIIPEDDWDVLLERNGEELGVFLPHIPPRAVPYQKAHCYKPKNLACFMTQRHNIGKHYKLREVNSLEDCIGFKETLCREFGLNNSYYILSYDERMIGSPADQILYRDRVDKPGGEPKWRPLEDAEDFRVMLNLHPEPMWIHIQDRWAGVV